MKILLYLNKFTYKVGMFGVMFQISHKCTILPHHDFVLNFVLFLSIKIVSFKKKTSVTEGAIS